MLIKGEVLMDTFTFGFSVHGQRGGWTLVVTAPSFPGNTTSEDTTTEPTWYRLFNEMISDAYEGACRKRFPGREIVTEVGQ